MITNTIRKLPVSAEFCLVILVCFWWGIFSSIMAIATQSWKATSPTPHSFIGIGIDLGTTNNEPMIVDVAPGTPAAAAGLSSGWIIRKIDDIPAHGMDIQDCVSRIHGPAGSDVTLELVDPTKTQTNTVTLKREKIPVISPLPHVTNNIALYIFCCEIAGLLITFWIARIRNWPLGTWGFKFSWKHLGGGVLLYLATGIVVWPIALVSNHISLGIVHRHFDSHLSLPVLILLVIINPIFEETMEVGYFVQTLQRHGIWITVLASAVFRAFLHAYQGIDTVLLILPIGLLFGLVYWRWRCLWPLFIVHAALDFAAFFPR